MTTTSPAGSSSRIRILGHRGASAHLPENTLASYEAAIREGAEGIESDVHKSKDDVIVMFHDPTLNRTTNGTGKIKDQNWYGNMENVRTTKEPIQPIPTFDQLIELIMRPENMHVVLNIDVKIFSDPNEIFPLMAKIIQEYPDYESVLSPRLILGLWHPLFIPPANKYLPSLTKFHIGLSLHIARKYFWDSMDGFSIAFPMLTSADGQKFLRDCKRSGKEVMTWTVNEKQDMRVAKTWGIEWLITDRVLTAVQARDEWEANESVLQMTALERFKWSWLNWKHYSIPQAMFLRWVEDNLTKNSYKPGPLEDALLVVDEEGEQRQPVSVMV